MFAILTEHYATKWPFWLNPRQVLLPFWLNPRQVLLPFWLNPRQVLLPFWLNPRQVMLLFCDLILLGSWQEQSL
jgi:threonyl-tRNA synthetase